MLNAGIKSHIDKIWDALWSGGIANPLTCMEQISYFLFMRRISEQDEQARQKAEFSGKDHQSVFEGHDDCRWDHFRHLEGDEMLKHVRDVVFIWLKDELGQGDNLFARSMKDAAFIIPKGSLMVEMVNTIDAIYAEIEKEVVLVGVLDHFEIWSRENWEKENMSMEKDMKEEDARNEIARIGL